jgi:cation transport ATPase
MISEDLFLDKLNASNQSQNFNQDEFISSEINRQFEQAQKRLTEVNTNLEDTTAKKQLTEDQNKQLQKNQKEASILVDQYEKAIKSLKTKISKTEAQKFYLTQHTLDFDSAEEKQKIKEENESLKSQLKSQLRSQLEEEIEDYKDEQLKKWQKKVWWNLFWVLPAIIFVLLILIPNELFHIQETENNKRQIDIVINISGALLTLFFLYILWYRYYNEIAISKKRESFRIPKELKNKLSDSL